MNGKRGRRPRRSTPSNAGVWVSAGLVVLVLAVFLQVRHFEFVALDDPLYVTENPHIAEGVTASSVAWAFTTFRAANWHPLTWLSHMMDVQFFGLDAGAHHLTSVWLHLVNTLLVFWLLRRITGGVFQSALVAALFGIHPLHVESVAWVSERKDVLSTLFWLLATWAYVAYVRSPGARRYLTVMVLFMLGLMAKPMLVTLPLTLLLLDVWPLGRWTSTRDTWRLVREKLPLFALSIASGVVTFIAQREGGAVSSLTDVTIAERASNALSSYVGYLRHMVWPADLAGFYPLRLDMTTPEMLWALLLIGGVSVVSIRLASRAPYLVVGWGWYLVTLVPVIGLVQVGAQAMADRYTYVPMIGIAIVLAWGGADLVARRPRARAFAAVAATAVILMLAVRAHAQTQYWKDSTTFWTRAATVSLSVSDFQAHLGIGRVLRTQGRTVEAYDHFAKAVALQPDSADAQQAYGITALELNHLDVAVAALEAAARLQPMSAVILNDLAWALLKARRPEEARRRAGEAIRLQPGLAGAHGNLGLTYAVEGKFDLALPPLREALRLDPGFDDARVNLARALAALGRFDDAKRELNEVLRRTPGHAAAAALLGQLPRS